MLLTPEQMYEIQKIINDHHLAFTVNSMGEDAVPPEVLKELKKKGLVKDPLNSMSEAYLYGHLLGTKENKATAGMSYRDFKQYMENNDIPLTALERGAMAMAAKSAGQYCRGLGNRVDVATGAMLIEADRMLRARMESDIRTATAENIARRETIKQLKTDLGWATQDWARDLERIAITEKVTAMNQGTADSFKKEHGADVLVAKRALPGACRHCQRLHTGPSGNPRVFKLRDLESNGTNVGKKANDWQAIVGATHPNCSCILTRLPTGWGFDESGEMVPGGKVDMYESPEDLKRSMRQEEELQKAFALQDHVEFQGIKIAIENKDGSVRKWKDADGNTGETRMTGVSYGYIEGTLGSDEDEIDVFVGPDPRAEKVYIIEQQNPHNGTYDEQKCFLGFSGPAMADRAYRLHYDNPDSFIVSIQAMDIDAFKRWVDGGRPSQGETVKVHVRKNLRLVILVPNEEG